VNNDLPRNLWFPSYIEGESTGSYEENNSGTLPKILKDITHSGFMDD